MLPSEVFGVLSGEHNASDDDFDKALMTGFWVNRGSEIVKWLAGCCDS